MSDETSAGRNLKWPLVYDTVRARIKDGTLKPGAAASVRALALEFGLGEVTAARAVARLARDGFLQRSDGIGYVVREQPEAKTG